MEKDINLKIFKGNLIFTKTSDKFTIMKDSYIVVIDGKIASVSSNLPDKYKNNPIIDFKNNIIIPGMNDLHAHASQYKNLGIGMDKELLPWLNNYTFPEEAKFLNVDYAKKTYGRLIKDLIKNGTTRVALFATLHKDSTIELFNMLIKSGIGAYVGKVNMDYNCPDYLTENYITSLNDTEEIILKYKDKSNIVKPIITPRFVPSCSNELMDGLGKLSYKYGLPVQSHLSENLDEIAVVKSLHKKSNFYGEVYDKFGLFGNTPTLMAHCIHSSKEEINLIKRNNVTIVHCPTSNFNLGSGMMPVRKYLNLGINVVLGSDISAGHTCSLFKVIAYAIQNSKIKWQESGKKDMFLSTSEAFYMATKKGGSFFGKVGSFEEGYDFDALVINDSNLYPEDYDLTERLERFIYLGDDRNIMKRYVCGNEIFEPKF
ncbi:amidohydrolase [Clostridium acetobutylicum]|nr:amidohydrolase [Clostridium acetobutylicum]